MHSKNPTIHSKIVLILTIFIAFNTCVVADGWLKSVKGTWGVGAGVLQSNYAKPTPKRLLHPIYLVASVSYR